MQQWAIDQGYGDNFVSLSDNDSTFGVGANFTSGLFKMEEECTAGTVKVAGSGYTSGDLLTVVDGTGASAIAYVDNVGGSGEVNTINFTGAGANRGSGYVDTFDTTTTGGTGTGAELTLTVGNIHPNTEGSHELGKLIATGYLVPSSVDGGSPTLTTPYSDRTDNIGDVIADVNYESNIAGATSYRSSGFPAGIDTSDLSASGGTLVASGKFSCSVEGANEFGSVGDQFTWTVNPVESLVSETAVQQVVNGSPFDLRNPDNHNIMSSGPAHNFFGVRFYSDAEGTTEVPITGTADIQIETVEAPLDSIAEEGVTGQRWSMAGNCKSGTITFTGGNVAHYFKVFASQNKT